jgi:hypothetical protein
VLVPSGTSIIIAVLSEVHTCVHGLYPPICSESVPQCELLPVGILLLALANLNPSQSPQNIASARHLRCFGTGPPLLPSPVPLPVWAALHMPARQHCTKLRPSGHNIKLLHVGVQILTRLCSDSSGDNARGSSRALQRELSPENSVHTSSTCRNVRRLQTSRFQCAVHALRKPHALGAVSGLRSIHPGLVAQAGSRRQRIRASLPAASAHRSWHELPNVQG